MIYVPDLDNYSYFRVIDNNTIRAYESSLSVGSDINYRDYFVNSHYLYNDGVETITSIPTFLDNDVLTDSFYYRNDFCDILIIFILLSLFCFYFPIKLFSKLFRKKSVVC